ncbi:MAG: ribonuclease E/G, partial [Rhizomicrobium sp.]
MPKRMLIDANHPEETRVVVLDGQKVEEFDFESASKRPLKGNIYLAKVTRVEPSLQAAFVEYGGNRQGFLAFSEIHPDYYQIPVSDREALLAEAEAEARRRQEDDFESFDIAPGEKPDSDDDEEEDGEETADNTRHDDDNGQDDGDAPVALHDDASESGVEFGISAPSSSQPDTGEDAPEQNEGEQTGAETGSADAAPADAAGGEAALSAQRPSQRWMRKRHYKIQEVIKRRQIILVQVVKEERGNKGAALTTYLSLAGRYCVLMPNTPRGGGISRKITNAADRKRLKSAAQSLNLPEGMGLIIRTAGGNRTKLEIKRDYEYLLRMWDTIREQTLQSVAPSCVYEEGDLVKRAIRDLYNKDVEEVLVEGEAGYRNAKDFMRMLMPSHAKNVKPYKETVPLFQRFHIEAQLDAMFSPIVTLKSGGYIVIDQTEALVAIDVNSGRATKEHSIEDTATKTNLEAADEVGRQLRLRDLAGLIVVDFIDMEDSRNDRLVEKRMMNAVKNDRARIQVGKISQFGLLEMSRQRLRAGVVAGSTLPCPHCGGSGLVRSVESTSLRVLRGIEEEAQKQRAESLLVHVATDAAIYTLNQKRAEITRVEAEYDITIAFEPTNELK